jgi:chromosome segregation ATPase
MASAVTYEMVEQICNDLSAAGASPTYLKVHEKLGRGSTRVVSAHIRQWREARAGSTALARDPLFGEWPEALQLKARSLFDALLVVSSEAASASAETLRAEFRLKEEALKRQADEAADDRAAALDALRSERATTDRLSAELESQQEASVAQRTMIDDLLGQRELHIAQCAGLERRLESLRDEHARHVSDLGFQAAAERERLLTEIRKEQDRSAGEREHLMRQTDQLRQDHAAAVNELRQRVGVLDANLSSQRSRTAEAEGRAAELAALTRQLETEAARMSAQLTALQDELARLQAQQLASTTTIGNQETQMARLELQLQFEAERARTAEAHSQALMLMRAASPSPELAPGPPEGDATMG